MEPESHSSPSKPLESAGLQEPRTAEDQVIQAEEDEGSLNVRNEMEVEEREEDLQVPPLPSQDLQQITLPRPIFEQIKLQANLEPLIEQKNKKEAHLS